MFSCNNVVLIWTEKLHVRNFIVFAKIYSWISITMFNGVVFITTIRNSSKGEPLNCRQSSWLQLVRLWFVSLLANMTQFFRKLPYLIVIMLRRKGFVEKSSPNKIATSVCPIHSDTMTNSQKDIIYDIYIKNMMLFAGLGKWSHFSSLVKIFFLLCCNLCISIKRINNNFITHNSVPNFHRQK
jgi:hypothetical protein